MIAQLDPLTTPNGSGLTTPSPVIRDLPKIAVNPPVFQPGATCWVEGIGGHFECRVNGLRCSALWVENDFGQAELLQPEWEYEVVSVKQLTMAEFPVAYGWCKATELCSVQPED